MITATPRSMTRPGPRSARRRVASGRRAPQSLRSRPARRLAAQKLASGFFASETGTHARQVAAQLTSTHQENSVTVVTMVLGYAVAPNSATRATGGQYSHTNANGTVVLTPFTTAVNRLQTALDAAGVLDPTPISDGVNALIYAGRGQWGNMLISMAGTVPYVGDLAKGGKYGAKAFKAGNKLANKQVTSVASEFGLARKDSASSSTKLSGWREEATLTILLMKNSDGSSVYRHVRISAARGPSFQR